MLGFHGGIAGARGGYLGVSTFFTLSGFLITSLLLHEYAGTGRISVAKFWTRRFRRLMPAALFALAGVAVYGQFIATTEQLWRLRADSLAALLYFSNWRFFSSGLAYEDLFGRPFPVQHFWSLSIEEQFYLGFPLLLIALLRMGRSRSERSTRIAGFGITVLAGASLVLSAGLHQPEGPVSRVYYGTDTRAAELLIGAVLAFVHAGRIRTGALGPNRWLDLAGAGGLLFSVMLWLTASPSSVWLFEGGLGMYALASSAIIVAALSFRLLEQPVRTGSWLPRYRLWIAAPVAMMLVAGSLIGVTRNLRVPWYYDPVFALQRPMPRAKAPNGTRLPKILFLGDSVGWTLAEGMVRWSAAAGRAAVWNTASSGYGIARGGQSVLAPGQPQRNVRCALWQDWWGIQLDKFQPDAVVMLAGLWDLTDRQLMHWKATRGPGDPLFDDWLLSEYQAAEDLMASRGARVFWLTHPCISSHPGKNIT